MQVESIDHLVLTVRNLSVSCQFYTQVLGMQVITFSDDRKALRFGNQKINLHEVGREFEPKAANPTPGSGDLCFITQTPLQQVIDHIHSWGIEPLTEPVQRTGAIGSIRSIYLRDPDGNLIEISNYAD